MKLDKLLCKIMQGFLVLFVSIRLRVISQLSALNMRVACTKIDRRSMEDVKTWSKADKSIVLADGQKKQREEMKASEDIITGLKRKAWIERAW